MHWRYFPALFWALISSTAVAATENGLSAPIKFSIDYDQAADILNVSATEMSLSKVLGHIAVRSGVEILVDPAVEKPVSINIEEQSLEAGLRQITRGLSTVFIYDDAPQGSDGTPMLVTMKLLPEGKASSEFLKPVVQLQAEANQRARARQKKEREQSLQLIPGGVLDHAEQRWQARLDKLPEEERRRLEENSESYLERRARKREEDRQEQLEEEREEAREEAERLAELEDLRQRNPKRYDLKMQRREENRRKAREQAEQNRPAAE